MMDFEKKVNELKIKINRVLTPLIDNDYVLWDCPYHSNIGDTLIWEGECTFLQELPYKCLGYASHVTCTFPELSPDVIILFHGGGNFGDIWREAQDFRLEVVRRYPHNRIIVFPQTVYYQDTTRMQEDARAMSEHSQLILCTRDQGSYDILKCNFRNPILLVPDMAFFISSEVLAKYRQREQERILFLKRTDKELASATYFIEGKELPIEVREWPSMEGRLMKMFLFEKWIGLNRRFNKWGLDYLYKCSSRMINWYALHFLRSTLIKMGVEFISCYHSVYTTRLHVMILSILLGKKCTFFDNSYGKNSAFYETWLKDVSGIKRAE